MHVQQNIKKKNAPVV